MYFVSVNYGKTVVQIVYASKSIKGHCPRLFTVDGLLFTEPLMYTFNLQYYYYYYYLYCTEVGIY